MKKLEEKFQVVKQYIKDNPSANIQTVADETETTVKTIKQWVREERLTFAEGSLVGLECESCGAIILTGRFCDKCKNKVHNEITQAGKRPVIAQPKKPDKDNPRMRFLDQN